jgi:GyrI-like small molecule binding domain
MKMRFFKTVGFGILLLSLGGVESGQQPDGAVPPKVEVSRIPSAIVIYREVTGPYSQHPVVFDQLMQYVGKNYRAVGACFGIYPKDPDAVEVSELRWEIGVRVVPGEALGYGKNLPIEELPNVSDARLRQTLRRMKQPEAPYKLKILEGTTAAVVDSTVARAPQDGLAMIPWAPQNGYVQTGPTRMEYLSHEGTPTEMRVKIIVPVKKRESGLKLSN